MCRRRWRISLAPACSPYVRNWVPCYGNSRRISDGTSNASASSSSCCRATLQKRRELARLHDDKLKYGTWTKIDKARPLRHCVEIRHPTFLVPEFFALLREFNIAFVFADTAKRWPYAEDLTADFVYVRLHGDEQLYVSGYSPGALDWWAARVRLWAQGKQPADARLISRHKPKAGRRDVYVFFDNDAKVHAPFDAEQLAGRLGVPALIT